MAVIGTTRCPHGAVLGNCLQCFSLGGIYKMDPKTPFDLTPVPPKPKADETDAEIAARKRHERFVKIGVVESPGWMPEADYHRDFRGRTWFQSRTVMLQAEECLRIHHCPQCESFDNTLHRIVATRFFVRYETDPMQNFPALAHNTCHHCGFEEYYPLKQDPRKNEAQSEQRTAAEQRMRMLEAERKMALLQQQHDVLIGNMVRETAQRLGIPDNMLESEADSMKRIIERQQRHYEEKYKNVQQAVRQHQPEDYARIAKSIADPELRRQYVNAALEAKGIIK